MKDGLTFTELSFTAEYRRWRATNQQATFRRAGSTGAAIALGNVRTWDVRYTARRFNEHRSQRQHAGGVIEASGTYAADPALTLAQRRTALLALQRTLLTEVNSADGTLVYGDFTQTVRVEEFKAEINQAERGIDWTFTATYSLFPNEAGYATCEFSVAQREQVEDGEEFLAFSGRIGAQNGAAARAKLTSLRASLLAIYGYADTQRVRGETTVNGIDANGQRTAGISEGLETTTTDGVSFMELSFNEEYRRRKSNLLGWNLQVNTRDDGTTGLVLATYSGFVTASGANAGAAYATALAKAQSLGSGKEAALTAPNGAAAANGFLRSAQITWEQRQTQSTASIEFVRLTFSYEYQAKLPAGRSYVEINTQLARDTFGVDTDNVSGFVVAVDLAKAEEIYQAQVRAGYNGLLLRNENTTLSKVKAEASAATYTTQAMRLEFAFTVVRVKAVAAFSLRYSLEVSRDFMTCEKATHVRGSVFAATREQAEVVLDELLEELELGSALRESRVEDREWMNGLVLDPEATEPRGLLIKLDFDVAYTDRLTGVSGLLEFRLTEEVQYSGTRWAVQPLPFSGTLPAVFDPANPPAANGGVSVVQPTGVEPGARTVRGSVTAAARADCEAWAKLQRSLLTGSYPQPEKWDWDYDLVPRTQGLVSGANPDVKVHRLSFTFAEILPRHPRPA